MDIYMNAKRRLIHYDLLRILACLSVIMLHSAAQFWYVLPVDGWQWRIANSYDALFRFGVPIFVMISGALFLAPDRDIQIESLYKKNIFRLTIAYIFWSIWYGLWDCRTFDRSLTLWKAYLNEMISGRYHLWFVPMLIGLYMLLPILKTWLKAADRKQVEYFITLFLIFQIGRETILIFVQSGAIRSVINILSIEMVGSYVGYFILGYYIVNYSISRKFQKLIYLGGICSAVLCVIVSNALSYSRGEAIGSLFDSYSIFTFLIGIAIFTYFQYEIKYICFDVRMEKLIRKISDATFGIYLIHLWLIEALEWKGIHSMSVNNIIGIPLLAVACFLIGLCITMILGKIPILKRVV